ncbi:ABC transporter ATP-binding protein, partial [Enterococcus sp. S181_ASV_20]|nr:ABC transporter ATP-binding protein [Enterococcus sp. S181_ASV_20]
VAINVDPDILIVDEALAVGDLEFQLKCMEKFTELRNAGKTILFVSHDVNAVRRFCDRVYWLKNGVVEAEGETMEITE